MNLNPQKLIKHSSLDEYLFKHKYMKFLFHAYLLCFPLKETLEQGVKYVQSSGVFIVNFEHFYC